ncbi:protein FAM184A [Tachysurus vachellii]|uniref:protein FAM184A n=1 Tax=Tachysurus vachellii TaxID=175792 RepID=UPI00296B40DC|nr:protein FAM184A [Tachysurus vachellii]
MRRFFRVQRDEDYSQIQYLTAKCSRLAQEKAAMERECVVSRERVRVLQVELEAVCLQLHQKENTIQELVEKLQHQQHVVSASDAALLSVHLESINSELQYLQSTEKQLIGFVEELHQQALHATKKAEGLEAQLHQEAQLHAKHRQNQQEELESKSHDLQELQKAHDALQQELSEQNSAHKKTVIELQHENTISVHKLRELAEQVEWLCEQQRNWICCIKRFKDCLNDEKEALVLQVNRLQEELLDLRKNTKSEAISREDTLPKVHCSRWHVDAMLDLQVEADKWKERYQELFNKFTSHQVDCHEDGYLKPP